MSTQLIIGPDGRVVTRPRYGGIKPGWSAYTPPVVAVPVEDPVVESSAPVEITITVTDDLGADLWKEE